MENRANEESTSSAEPDSGAEQKAKKPSKSLASVIARRGTDIIAIGIGLMLCIYLGSNFADIWGRDESPVEEAGRVSAAITGQNPLGERPEDGLRMRFGGSRQHLYREVFRGDETAVLVRMLDEAEGMLRGIQAAAGQPGPKETKLLKRIADRKPERVLEGKTHLHSMSGPFPMIAATTIQGDERRLVLWGVAVQSGKQQYRVTLCRVGDSEADSDRPQLPVPTGARPLVELASGAGGMISGMKGSGKIARWRVEIAQGLRDQGWSAIADWKNTPAGSRARFAARTGPTSAWIDVVISRLGDSSEADDFGPLSVTYVVTPLTTETNLGDK